MKEAITASLAKTVLLYFPTSETGAAAPLADAARQSDSSGLAPLTSSCLHGHQSTGTTVLALLSRLLAAG
jgi:hypothetical protein